MYADVDGTFKNRIIRDCRTERSAKDYARKKVPNGSKVYITEYYRPFNPDIDRYDKKFEKGWETLYVLRNGRLMYITGKKPKTKRSAQKKPSTTGFGFPKPKKDGWPNVKV